ncbi:MAG: hypothetical protein H7250_06460 [Flavobacterium sp.]|nr:hypothetical protein [Flavobacterium sp.]
MCKKKIIFSLVILLLFYSCKETKTEQNVKIEKKTKKTSLILPTNNEIGEINNIYNGCGYNYTLSEAKINLKVASEREIEQIKSILSYSGLPINFDIYSADIENAVAVMIDNKRYIIYDPRLLQYTDVNSNSYWSSMSILAHEIGHHLSGHTLNNNNDKLNNELQADKFSGFILYKLGATLIQAQTAINQLGTEQDTDTHPSKYKRMDIIKKGWEEASIQRYESAVPPAPADDKSFGGKYRYVKDEFFKEELIDEKELNEENFGGGINGYNYPYQEGIIIDVEKKGYEGDMRAENFDRDPSENNMTLTIKLTKDSKSPFGDINKVGSRIKFNLMDYYHMSHADVSWFEALLVPGRKIRFKSFYYGYEAEDIFYIKKLNR